MPPGRHETTIEEVRRRFGIASVIRGRLFKGLSAVAARARKAGAGRLYLNGSFVTDKKGPGDWDAVLVVPVGFNPGSKDGAFLADRKRIKEDYGGDLFVIYEDDVEILEHYVDQVFGHDRHGRPKGMLVIDLTDKEKTRATDQE